MIVNKRRTEIEILRDILKLTREQEGAKKTQILYQTNLSYNQLQHYLSYLLDRDFLFEDSEGMVTLYRMTDEGEELLANIDTVIASLTE